MLFFFVSAPLTHIWMYVCTQTYAYINLCSYGPTLHIQPYTYIHRGKPIRVNAVLHIVFECIAIYCHITILDWILVKDIS